MKNVSEHLEEKIMNETGAVWEEVYSVKMNV